MRRPINPDFNSGLNKGSTLVLVDSDIDRDMRVRRSIEQFGDYNIVDCRKHGALLSALPTIEFLVNFVRLCVHALKMRGLPRRLKDSHDLAEHYLFRGLIASLWVFYKSHLVARKILASKRNVKLVLANDLFCGVVGYLLAKKTGAKLIYDSHEIQFHRNRRNSKFRMVFDFALEDLVFQRSFEVRVVNQEIFTLYRTLHGNTVTQITVVNNNNFEHHENKFKGLGFAKPSFVYVGGGISGRHLDLLADFSDSLDFNVHAFFIGDVPRIAYSRNWYIGGGAYLDDLLRIVSSRRCLMWCCLSHSCLSYRLSLPNKFFQALAVCIPVIVSPGGYLERLVRQYKIGLIFETGASVEKLKEDFDSGYDSWVSNVIRFRADVSSGRVRV